jgi:S-adenosylmethionine:tRNA ribosyltransferase-isomerase
MDLSEFDFALAPDRIAQRPARPREAARLLVLPRGSDAAIGHARVRDLPDLLVPGDLLVLNDTRVIHARLRGTKAESGGRVEILLLAREAPRKWSALARGLGHARVGAKIRFASERLAAEVLQRRLDRSVLLAFSGPDAEDPSRAGEIPIPPYIRRGVADASDSEDYQTCYAARPGAVAAPTAGLHFTPGLLDALLARGVERTRITLHVGWGTFAPLVPEDLATGRLHPEFYEVNEVAARAVNAARRQGRRVISVGTTSARVLESVADARGHVAPGKGWTDLFVLPGYAFRAIDGLLTNFHLPRSSLLLLVCAFAGRTRLLGAYEEALQKGYRFYSYGDAMLIL